MNIKLRIFNIKEFLKIVNECTKAVNIIYPNGSKENINSQYCIQKELRDEYYKNQNILNLSLNIPTFKDYLSIINYYIGDC